mmetsp:Transcript_15365/g.31853  ORF Transcript_15365/g.31853 Transcript_15365/m.31853 type:complete len:233 (+) Transcript_15365:510-1208(+)
MRKSPVSTTSTPSSFWATLVSKPARDSVSSKERTLSRFLSLLVAPRLSRRRMFLSLLVDGRSSLPFPELSTPSPRTKSFTSRSSQSAWSSSVVVSSPSNSPRLWMASERMSLSCTAEICSSVDSITTLETTCTKKWNATPTLTSNSTLIPPRLSRTTTDPSRWSPETVSRLNVTRSCMPLAERARPILSTSKAQESRPRVPSFPSTNTPEPTSRASMPSVMLRTASPLPQLL